MIALSSADPIECCKAAGQHVEQILPVSGGLPIFAHRNVGYVLPQLHLQLDTDPSLLIQAAGVEPRSAQGFDARAHRPAVEGGEPVSAYPGVAIGVGVWVRSIEEEGKNQFVRPLRPPDPR